MCGALGYVRHLDRHDYVKQLETRDTERIATLIRTSIDQV